VVVVALLLGDYDNDGDIDIAVGMINVQPRDGMNVIYENKLGDLPIFTLEPAWYSADYGDTVRIQFADVDRDGKLELISASKDGRIVLYDNTARGLERAPEDPFRVTGISTCPMTGFVITHFGDDLLNTSCEHASDLDLLCSWVPTYFSGVYTDISSWSPPSFDPMNPSYKNTIDKSTDGNYLCQDINGDGIMDWVAFSYGGITAGLCTGDRSSHFSFEIIQLVNNDDMQYAEDFAVMEAPDYPDRIYIAVASRGYRSHYTFPEYTESQDYIFSTSIYDNGSYNLVWQDELEVPTLSIGFADFNSDAEYISSHIYNSVLSSTNQTIVFPGPLYCVDEVILNKVKLHNNQYHIDIMNGQISIIGGNAGDQIQISYSTSTGVDLVCARNGRNAVYYHD